MAEPPAAVPAGGNVPADGNAPAGRTLVIADVIGTVVFSVVALGAALGPTWLTLPVVITSLLMFAVGTGAFLWAYAVAIGRSRHDQIGMGGLFFLAGTAPRGVQVRLMGALGVQIVVALVAASLKAFTGVAFAVLAPMFGLGLAGLWGARYGTFPRRPGDDRPGGGRPTGGRPSGDT
jgi:hypothetical protein